MTMNLYDAAKKISDAFTFDPGHSDLDDEQPVTIFVTLGDLRRLNTALMCARPSECAAICVTDGCALLLPQETAGK